MSQQLLKAIGSEGLIQYFQELDAAELNGKLVDQTAIAHLAIEHRGMSLREAFVIAKAWRVTHSIALPAEDRAMNALED
ncbi:hypothetical protein [Bradyrhizobium prioriisuperbiae]|uniref:hypothetical protein n=1 Tax=Bradyrhizobium prioriisuperbiae TaxID=2854389 RepID=UPI0028EF08C0|nr:hypothetical protein [Bradyrhizobium prioritasuperba]